MHKKFTNIWKANRSFILLVALMFMFRSSLADWNEVPTGSMKPTIVEGDRIFVNKMAYDLRIPFTHISLHEFAEPTRGDIIVFDSAVSEKRLVKRVIGVPGDRVELRRNVLYLNGIAMDYEELGSSEIAVDLNEDLLGIKHQIRIFRSGSRLSSFPEITVPRGHYLAMGDNRDNSADSRVIGFVPRNEIVGKALEVVISLDYDKYYLPRTDRFLKPL